MRAPADVMTERPRGPFSTPMTSQTAAKRKTSCAVGSWGGQRPSLGGSVTVTGSTPTH
jgi:hypothetical protein